MTTNYATQIEAAKQNLEAAKAKLEKLLKQESAADLIANVKPQEVITYLYGRGKTRAEFTGEVRTIIETEKGRVIRVIKGTGVDEEIVSIRPSDIVGKGKPVVAEFSEEEAATAEASFMAAQNANDDPLASIN